MKNILLFSSVFTSLKIKFMYIRDECSKIFADNSVSLKTSGVLL